MSARWLLLPLALLTTLPASADERHEEAASAAKNAEKSGLSALFAASQKSPGLSSRFREKKHIALLSAPLVSEGTLHFDRRHGLVRHTQKPQPSSVLLTEHALRFWDGKQTESVALRGAPELKVFVDSFRMILAADQVGLQKHFVLDFSGDANADWQLKLTPKDPTLKKAISAIELRGNQLNFSQLTVFETSGDKTITEFFESDTKKRFSAAEAQKLFRLPQQP